MRPTRAFLDANVLVDAQVRDVFLRLASAGLVTVAWSHLVLAETERALIERLAVPNTKAHRLMQAIATAFPLASVADFEHRISDLELLDPDDRHVAAAAIESDCDFLVTFNLGDFDGISETIEVLSPDDALTTIIEPSPTEVLNVIVELVRILRKPPTTLDEFLRRLATRTPNTAAMLRSFADAPPA